MKEELIAIDNELSKRDIALDPAGYFIIYLDPEAQLICAKHYTNNINEQGLAVDPETQKVIPAKGKVERTPTAIYTGRTAKEITVKIVEQSNPPITKLDHAAYLGREFQRAQTALIAQQPYIQD